MSDKNRRPASLSFKTTASRPSEVTRDLFLEVFMRNLIEAKNKSPERYVWTSLNVLDVFRAFVESFENGSFSKNTEAVKWTCKELKIDNSRESIAKIFGANAEITKE